MTLNEFKAWLDGFTDSMCGAPTDAQWTKIKKRLAEIDDRPTVEKVFVDRYVNKMPDLIDWSKPYYKDINKFYCGMPMNASGTQHDLLGIKGQVAAEMKLKEYKSVTSSNYAGEGAMGMVKEAHPDFDSQQAFWHLGKEELKAA